MAFDLPENGGTLVAVISENTLYYNQVRRLILNDKNRKEAAVLVFKVH